jgi:hypothetical protein
MYINSQEEFDKSIEKDILTTKEKRYNYKNFDIETIKTSIKKCYFCKNFKPEIEFKESTNHCIRHDGWCKLEMWKNLWSVGIYTEKQYIKNINDYKEDEVYEKEGSVIEHVEYVNGGGYDKYRIYGISSSDTCENFNFDKETFGSKVYSPVFKIEKSVEFYSNILGLSVGTIRSYFKDIKSTQGYIDNSGRWSSSYYYKIYNIEDVLEYLKEYKPRHYLKVKEFYDKEYHLYNNKLNEYEDFIKSL